MVIVGARGTYAEFSSRVLAEFQGPLRGSFLGWFISLVAVGALGYIQDLQQISRYLLALVILVLFLSHKGFFEQFMAALNTGPKQPSPIGQSPQTGVLDLGPFGSLNTSPSTIFTPAAPLDFSSIGSFFQSWFSPKGSTP